MKLNNKVYLKFFKCIFWKQEGKKRWGEPKTEQKQNKNHRSIWAFLKN